MSDTTGISMTPTQHSDTREQFEASAFFRQNDRLNVIKDGTVAHMVAVSAVEEAYKAGQADRAAQQPALSDDEIVKILASLGIDTYPSKYGFPALQVSATSVPMIREIVAAYLAAQEPQ